MSEFTHHPHGLDDAWTFDPARTYPDQTVGIKPEGFWLSVDDDWRRWCEGEELDWANPSPVAFDVDTNRLLWLRTVNDLDEFHAEHGFSRGLSWRAEASYIDWSTVADEHAGIIIAPYLWERRLDGPLWYYSWDCASACVWDLTAVRVTAQVTA